VAAPKTTAVRPESLAVYSASSADAMRSLIPARSRRDDHAPPTLTVTMEPSGAWICSASTAARIRSATTLAWSNRTWSSSTTNSSPPYRVSSASS
jgi:hypothetical protein